MKNKLVTHVVAGYPTGQACLELMFGMQEAGVNAIEVQIPFTDPTADGPDIMKANDIALAGGMTIENCFKLIRKSRKAGLVVPIYIMTYVNKLHHFGFTKFCEQAQQCQIAGLIVPDLPVDMPEHSELAKVCAVAGLQLVPVLSPGTDTYRLKRYGLETRQLVYVTSSKGITGNQLTVEPELIELLKTIRTISDCEIALGFGIQNLSDVRKALELADIAVIGSEVIRKITQGGISKAALFVKQLVKENNHDN